MQGAEGRLSQLGISAYHSQYFVLREEYVRAFDTDHASSMREPAAGATLYGYLGWLDGRLGYSSDFDGHRDAIFPNTQHRTWFGYNHARLEEDWKQSYLAGFSQAQERGRSSQQVRSHSQAFGSNSPRMGRSPRRRRPV